MGIWDRLETVIKSYISGAASGGEDSKIHWRSGKNSADPDLNAAYDELNDFLHGTNSGTADMKTGASAGAKAGAERKRAVPEHLHKDFAELGLTPDATSEECKEAYKKLLKVHHPDRHASHDENMKKATEKTARVNAAYDRLEKWFKG